MSIKVYATSDVNKESPTAVVGHYPPLNFQVPFNPQSPKWEELRKVIEREIGPKYHALYGEHCRHWVWGLYGSREDGRTFDRTLYDHDNGFSETDRRAFAQDVTKANTTSKFTIKAKWSWPLNGCADLSSLPDTCQIDARVCLTQRELDRNARVKARAAPTYSEHAAAKPFSAQVKVALENNFMGRAVAVMKFSRFPDAFRMAVEKCPVLASRREDLEAHGFESVLGKGAKVFLNPELYPGARAAIARMECRTLLSSHVVTPLELVIHIAQLGAGLEGEKVRLLEEKSQVLHFDYAYQLAVNRTFLEVLTPKSPGPKTVSTTDVDRRRDVNPRPLRHAA
jgi:hypothetical protein